MKAFREAVLKNSMFLRKPYLSIFNQTAETNGVIYTVSQTGLGLTLVTKVEHVLEEIMFSFI